MGQIVPLFSPQIPHTVTPDETQTFCGERLEGQWLSKLYFTTVHCRFYLIDRQLDI